MPQMEQQNRCRGIAYLPFLPLPCLSLGALPVFVPLQLPNPLPVLGPLPLGPVPSLFGIDCSFLDYINCVSPFLEILVVLFHNLSLVSCFLEEASILSSSSPSRMPVCFMPLGSFTLSSSLAPCSPTRRQSLLSNPVVAPVATTIGIVSRASISTVLISYLLLLHDLHDFFFFAIVLVP